MPAKKILVVEDEIVVARDIQNQLEHLGYEVLPPANSKQQALALVVDHQPDLILMDIVITGEANGIDTAKEIRSRFQIPVIYLTAHTADSLLNEAAMTEPYGYLIKPFDIQELAATIKMALYKAEMESQLRLSEEWLSTTLNSIGDGVIATDTDGRVSFMNPVAEDLTGWAQSDAAGRPLEEVFEIVNEDSRLPVETPVNRVLREGVVVGLANHTVLIAKSRVEYPIDDSGAPIRNRKGEITGVVLVFRDISEKRQAERVHKKLASRVQQSQKLEALGSLAGGIARDFDDILQVILAATEKMAAQLSDDHSCQASLDEIKSVLDRGRDAVNQVLTLSSMESARLVPVDVAGAVGESVDYLRATLPKEIEIRTHFQASGAVIMADPERLHQVILNLCANAYAAIGEQNGTIDVTVSEGNGPDAPGRDCICISIKDNGVGIPESHMDRIFDPFFTTKDRDDDTGASIGIGLAAVHDIMESHGGTIHVDSREGVGTEVIIAFQATDQAPCREPS